MELDTILAAIREADEDQLIRMADAITERYREVYPDWEVAFLALPLHDEERRKRTLEFVMKYGPRTVRREDSL